MSCGTCGSVEHNPDCGVCRSLRGRLESPGHLTWCARRALSSHDMLSPCTPAELVKLAAEMEAALVEGECQFSHPDWRYIDGLRALAEQVSGARSAA